MVRFFMKSFEFSWWVLVVVFFPKANSQELKKKCPWRFWDPVGIVDKLYNEQSIN